jgi:hypothetical protein
MTPSTATVPCGPGAVNVVTASCERLRAIYPCPSTSLASLKGASFPCHLPASLQRITFTQALGTMDVDDDVDTAAVYADLSLAPEVCPLCPRRWFGIGRLTGTDRRA